MVSNKQKNENGTDEKPDNDEVVDNEAALSLDGSLNDGPLQEEPNAESENAENEDPIVAVTTERDQLKDQLLRSLAENENLRRRTERDTASIRKYGHTPFARDLVGALDNLGRAVESAPVEAEIQEEGVKSLIKGIQLSWTELQAVIKKHGIERISPNGEKFDYNYHQAMFEVPTKEHPSGVVVEVVQHGYVLHDRLLRPAMVGVSKPVGDDDCSIKKDSDLSDED